MARTKEEIKAIIKEKVKEVWIGRRSMNPIEDQTNLLFDSLYPMMESYHKEKLREELIKYDEYLDEYVNHKRSELRVDTYLNSR